jgi:hypothetical protein
MCIRRGGGLHYYSGKEGDPETRTFFTMTNEEGFFQLMALRIMGGAMKWWEVVFNTQNFLAVVQTQRNVI